MYIAKHKINNLASFRRVFSCIHYICSVTLCFVYLFPTYQVNKGLFLFIVMVFVFFICSILIFIIYAYCMLQCAIQEPLDATTQLCEVHFPTLTPPTFHFLPSHPLVLFLLTIFLQS